MSANIVLPVGAAGKSDYVIPASYYFQQPQCFSRQFGSPTALHPYTISLWFRKVANYGADGRGVFGCGTSSNHLGGLFLGWSHLSNRPLYLRNQSNTTGTRIVANNPLTDLTKWHHLFLRCTQPANVEKPHLWIDGVEQTFGRAEKTATAYYINSNKVHLLGKVLASSYSAEAKLADFMFFDGKLYDVTQFGQDDGAGNWIPKQPENIDFSGNNSFHVNFADATDTTTLGYDVSGNNNHFSPQRGITLANVSADTPSNPIP